MRMNYKKKSWRFDSALIGRHNASNLLGAQAVGLECGLDETHLIGLQDFRGIPGRLEKVMNKAGLNIFIDFAHTPDALDNSLSAVNPLKRKRLLVLFGCGGDRDKKKRPAMGQVVSKYADIAYLTSDNPRNEDPQEIMAQVMPGLKGKLKVVLEVDRYEAIGKAVREITPEDILIIAGKGHEDYQEIGLERKYFSDLEAVKEWVLEIANDN